MFAAAPPVITTTSLPGGSPGSAYDQTIAVQNGVRPFTWSVTSGLLPLGLTLDKSQGRISGTPTLPGTFNFMLKVVDDDDKSDTRSVLHSDQLRARHGHHPLSVRGRGGHRVLGEPHGNRRQRRLHVGPLRGSLPAGLTLSSGGTISGMPTRAETSSFTVRATDSSLRGAIRQLSIRW